MSSTIESGFHLADSKGYMLGRGHAAACPPAIADVGTGTSIWLLDVARSAPDATLDGFDIDLSNTPPAQWLPKGLTLHNWSVFDPAPENLVGKYDVVHLRLLILVVENSDPVPVIRNVARLLKPGGYIQWDDLNYPDTHVEKADSTRETPAFDRLRQFVYSSGRHDWVMNLASILEQNGFTGAHLYHFRDRCDLITANGEQHLATMEEFAKSLDKKSMTEDAANIRKLLEDVEDEARHGVALSMPRVVAVAQKPGTPSR
ncbi:hypothetical protein N7470_007132 [Penicillium chermesinum]|nr:hypothetical protein N7470_007132 [Penicillium chermesinum]